MVLQFLADYRDDRFREAISNWFANALTTSVEAEGRGRAMLANELCDLSFEQILAFYGMTLAPEEEQPGA